MRLGCLHENRKVETRIGDDIEGAVATAPGRLHNDMVTAGDFLNIKQTRESQNGVIIRDYQDPLFIFFRTFL